MSDSLAVVLSQGYYGVAGALSAEELALVACLRTAHDVGPAERNRRLAAIVAAYRAGPRQLWAPVLLDLLAPAILERIQRLRALPPVVDADEIRQQFLVELLHVAATVTLPENGRWLKAVLLSRANQAVRRWLEREGRRQCRQSSWETMEEQGK